MLLLEADPHPLLLYGAFTTTFPQALGNVPSPPWLTDLLRLDAGAPLRRDEQGRQRIRDLLRHGGYKPTGRGKPASEYLARAAAEGLLAPINVAVDACNAVSLHSGIPISVVDLESAAPPYRIRLGKAGEAYVFNPAGQVMDLEGLLCLTDALGPCANAVKDSQRTKTGEATRRTLSILWAASGLEERLERALEWYREILERVGASTELCR